MFGIAFGLGDAIILYWTFLKAYFGDGVRVTVDMYGEGLLELVLMTATLVVIIVAMIYTFKEVKNDKEN